MARRVTSSQPTEGRVKTTLNGKDGHNDAIAAKKVDHDPWQGGSRKCYCKDGHNDVMARRVNGYFTVRLLYRTATLPYSYFTVPFFYPNTTTYS